MYREEKIAATGPGCTRHRAGRVHLGGPGRHRAVPHDPEPGPRREDPDRAGPDRGGRPGGREPGPPHVGPPPRL